MAKVSSIKKSGKEKENLTGTFISLGVVGGIILVTYIVLFGLFMARF